MAQPQTQADVHQDELCSPKKRYALMDANKKIDLYHLLCPNESKIMENILQNHPLRFIIAALSSVPWIYMEAIMQMLYCFVNNIHVDYIDLLWEGLHYSLEHPSTLIPYPRFTKLIVSHYMTTFPKISRRARDNYHNMEDDEMVKSMFNSGKNMAGLDPGSYKESLEVEKIVVVSQPVNVIEEEDESAEDDYELKRRGKRKNVEESTHTPSLTTIRSPRIHSTLISSDTEKLQELTVNDPPPLSSTPSSSSSKLYAIKSSWNLPRHKFQQSQADVEKMIADAIQQEHENLWAEITLQINNSITNHVPSQVNSSVRSFAFRTRDQDDPHDDAHPEGKNNVKT
ncbi:hypothetical protein Tco_1033519 [Tanacetum coccineum]